MLNYIGVIRKALLSSYFKITVLNLVNICWKPKDKSCKKTNWMIAIWVIIIDVWPISHTKKLVSKRNDFFILHKKKTKKAKGINVNIMQYTFKYKSTKYSIKQ